MYQKAIFGLFVILALTVQGCSLSPKNATDSVDTTVTTGTETVVETTDTGTTETTTTTTTETTTGTTTETAPVVSTINGTFHLTDTYTVPSGTEVMDVTVVVTNDVVTSVNAKNVAVHEKSKFFQDKFIAGVAGQVVGKKISEVKITNVNGSSLTAQAFDKALHNIKG